MAELPIRDRAGDVIARVLADEADLEWAGRYRWSLSRGYAVRGTCRGSRKTGLRRHTYLMHRELLGLAHGDKREADHVNRNKLDNRRSNLRIVTRAQNKQNLDSYAGGTSKHRGVSWNVSREQWVARGRLNGTVHVLGEYEREQDAAAVAAAWRREHMPFSEEAA